MIQFRPFRTRRIDVRMRELEIGQEIALCQLPESAHEKSITELLRYVIDEANRPSDAFVTDPRAWTVAERLFAVAHYLVHVREDGPNYAVTLDSKLLDYLDTSRELPAEPVRFEALGDAWTLQPLTGAAAETIESHRSEYPELSGFVYWTFASMAACLVREGKDVVLDPIAQPVEYADWLRARIDVVRKLRGTSEFDTLWSAYSQAHEVGSHYLRTWFDEDGIVVLPRQVPGKEADPLVAPARFRALHAVGTFALRASGKSQ